MMRPREEFAAARMRAAQRRLSRQLAWLYVRLVEFEEQLTAAEVERARSDPHAQIVYFIGRPERGPIKVGVSKNPVRRLGDLQQANPYPLAILRLEPGGCGRERELHSALAPWRLHGEWFDDAAPELRHVRVLHETRAA